MPEVVVLLHCSFCGKDQKSVEDLFAGGDPNKVFICNECVEDCARQLKKGRAKDEEVVLSLPAPEEERDNSPSTSSKPQGEGNQRVNPFKERFGITSNIDEASDK